MLNKWIKSEQPTVSENGLWLRLKELMECGFTSEDATDLIDTFLTDSAQSIDILDVNTDATALARAAHRLAGSSANLGLQALETAVRSMETAAKTGKVQPSTLEAVSVEYSRSCESLRRLRSRLLSEASSDVEATTVQPR